MTKLESIEHKIFASEAPLDEIGQFGSALDTTKLNTKDVTTIQALPAYTKGWGSAIISDSNYPTMEEMNGVLNVMSYHTGYLYQEGIPVWRNDREYSATSIVKEPTGTKLFHSLKDGNIGNTFDNTEYWEELKLGGSGLEVGDIGMALYVDETKGLRRYLNGQIVDINTNTQAFLDRLKEITTLYPSLLCTEDEWQTAKTMSAFGQVGKFVFNYNGDEIVSVRIPAIVNVQGLFDLQNLGMTVSAGLPNITGGFTSTALYSNADTAAYGAFKGTTTQGVSPTGGGGSGSIDTFDASRSNSIYGKSNTVQQEQIQYPYFIQIATGSETEANIVNALENVNGFTLLESKYSDKPLYNESWLLSNGQYNPKGTYPTAYEGLQVEYNTEIEAGTTVTLPSGVSYTKRGLSVKLSTETYTDYDFVLNTAEETFRLPLETKLASGKAVVGNGMTLGLSQNGDYGLASATLTSQQKLLAWTSAFGVQAGIALPDGGVVSPSNTTVGITTDPTKSGIETSDSGLYLYFYVGDIDQNHGIVNMGRIGEQLANKTDMLQASGAGMPSNRYIDLTLGASGSTYTAPANGWFRLVKWTTAVGQNIQFNPQELYRGRDNSDAWMYQFSSIVNQALTITLPVLKGQETWCYYSAGGDTVVFEFIYAEGSK